MSADVIQAAIAEARRRAAASDRDLQPAVAHFARQLQPVCRAWRLVPDHWFDGGAGMPTLAVTGPDGIPGVLKLAKPGELDADEIVTPGVFVQRIIHVPNAKKHIEQRTTRKREAA